MDFTCQHVAIGGSTGIGRATAERTLRVVTAQGFAVDSELLGTPVIQG